MPTTNDANATGQVFNIQRYCLHDGPGIRTLVFLKGCPLSCRWCSNPESQDLKPSLAFNPERCLGLHVDQYCVDACPHEALSLPSANLPQKPLRRREYCASCTDMPCAEACPAKAFLVYGKTWRVSDLLQKVEEDAAFHRGDGGLTLSGGEPLLQHTFTLALLREAHKRHLDCALETSGEAPWEVVHSVVPFLDCLIYDLKHMDAHSHRQATGVGNARILENLRRVVEYFPHIDILVRTPIVPQFNADEASVRAITEFLLPFTRIRYEMLPYHRLGTQKYSLLGREYPLGDCRLPTEQWRRLQALAHSILGERMVTAGD